MSTAIHEEQVVSVHHWTDRLFSIRTTRDPSLRFSNGHFTMIGLRIEDRPLVRAYSIASPNYEDHLEFLSIKVPDGPLTSRLVHIKPGDKLIVGRKPTGTLLVDNLVPGKHLYLLATGTGLAPFMSIVQDPEVYDRFEKVILVHGVRQVDELAYRDLLSTELGQHELLGEFVQDKLIYYPTVTREQYVNTGRITDLARSGRLFESIGQEAWNPRDDRVMICGSNAMNREIKEMLESSGFTEGSASRPGSFVLEKAFVE